MEVKLFCIFAEMKFSCTICVHSFKDPRHPMTSTFMTIRHRNLRRFQCIVKQFITLYRQHLTWCLSLSHNGRCFGLPTEFEYCRVFYFHEERWNKKSWFPPPPKLIFFVVFKSNTCWKSISFCNLKEWACMQNFF